MKKILLLFLMAAAMQVFADGVVSSGEEMPWTPIQFQLYPGVGFYLPETPVYGINVAGVGGSLFIAGMSVHLYQDTTEFYGFQLGGVSMGNVAGGFHLSLFNSASDNRGVQLGLVNLAGGSAPGIGSGDGGVQLGVFNAADGGFQFGLLNYNAKSAIPWMILVNWSFD